MAAQTHVFKTINGYTTWRNSHMRYNLSVIHMFPYPVQKVIYSRERVYIKGKPQPRFFPGAVPQRVRHLAIEGYPVPTTIPRTLLEVPDDDRFHILMQRERKIREKMKEMPMAIAQYKQERQQQAVERQERKEERARKLAEFMEAEKAAILAGKRQK
eukprot:scpid102529/ scgid19682/ 